MSAHMGVVETSASHFNAGVCGLNRQGVLGLKQCRVRNPQAWPAMVVVQAVAACCLNANMWCFWQPTVEAKPLHVQDGTCPRGM